MTRSGILVALAWTVAISGAVALVTVGGSGAEQLAGSRWLLMFLCIGFDVTAYASVGAALALRRPGNVIGTVLMAASILIAASILGFVFGASLTTSRGTSDTLAGLCALVGAMTIFPMVILAGPALAMVFPDGHLPGPRWRWPVAAIAVASAGGTALIIGRPGPLGGSLADNPLAALGFPWVASLSPLGDVLATAALPASLFLGVVAVVIRFRRSGGAAREQLKWFVAANVLLAVFLSLSLADGGTEPTVIDVVAVASLSLPPIAIGIAVLRYRLYDIDRLISRGLAWAVVSGVLVAIFAVGVVAIQALLAGFTQGQTLAVAGSTLVAFALFQPIRRWVQSAVDRRFDRARYDAERTMDLFAERIRNEVDLATLRADVQATAERSLRPLVVGLWFRADERTGR